MMSIQKKIHLLGYASGIGGRDPQGSAKGPLFLQDSSFMNELISQGVAIQWDKIITSNQRDKGKQYAVVQELCTALARQTEALSRQKELFVVIGGDHSCAIGTWSGVFAAKKNEGPIGLIWIDAHMDSHTPKTTPSGNIHGMPVACLLGYGDERLIAIADGQPKLQPEKICLIGIRSFEPEEAKLLEKLNVRVFYMDEERQRGLQTVMREAVQIASQGTTGYGVSMDIDSIDPADAPGTGAAEPNGIRAVDLYQALLPLAKDQRLIG